jgi:hypothetical protein
MQSIKHIKYLRFRFYIMICRIFLFFVLITLCEIMSNRIGGVSNLGLLIFIPFFNNPLRSYDHSHHH